MDELFKKVIRAVGHYMRKSFDDFLQDVDHTKVSEGEMTERLEAFLRTQFKLEDLVTTELIVAKQVFYSIAIKSRQFSFG